MFFYVNVGESRDIYDGEKPWISAVHELCLHIELVLLVHQFCGLYLSSVAQTTKL